MKAVSSNRQKLEKYCKCKTYAEQLFLIVARPNLGYAHDTETTDSTCTTTTRSAGTIDQQCQQDKKAPTGVQSLAKALSGIIFPALR